MADNPSFSDTPESAASPVRATPVDRAEPLREGIGLCLSGGGYRAMLFHLGALWRLNELGYLGKLDRISSVSGGSITAGVLGMQWGNLGITPDAPAPGFSAVVGLVRALAGRTIDIGSVFGGIFGPGTVSDKIANAYDDDLFHGRTLQDLPDTPRFVINATSVQSTALFRFSKPYAADWRVGQIRNPRIPLAVAVAASSAFPPLLSPVELKLERYGTVEDTQGTDLHRAPYTKTAILTDGGVYDNLGLETVWKRYKTVLVSDGGGQVEPEEDPHRDWARHSFRVLNLIDNQVRSLRKRQCIDAFVRKEREGAYWGIRTDIRNYQLPDALPCGPADTDRIARIPTRLKAMPEEQQEALINWGYAVCDAAMRKHACAAGPAPRFPYARGCRF